jgi:voltage-gated potassium channel
MADRATARDEPGEAGERWDALRQLEAWLETPMLALSFAWLLLVLAELVWGTSDLLETFGTAVWVGLPALPAPGLGR